MGDSNADFTNTFRALSQLPPASSEHFETAADALCDYLLSQCLTVKEQLAAVVSPYTDEEVDAIVADARAGGNPAARAAARDELRRRERRRELAEVDDDAFVDAVR